MIRIYLDACCLNRPFDDQTQARIRLEAEYDALHLACAESGSADVLLTTDDRLMRRSVAQATDLRVRVANPLTWLREVNET